MSEEIKKGLLGIVVDETTISQVMPDINSLTYRGYAVQDLCEKCTFEEVEMLEEVTHQIEGHTICALGDAAAWPIQGLLKHFKKDILKRIQKKNVA